MCHSRRAIGPTTRRVLRCAAPAPEALTDVTGEDARAGSKAVLPCDLLRLVVDGRHCSESPVGGGGVPPYVGFWWSPRADRRAVRRNPVRGPAAALLTDDRSPMRRGFSQ